MRETHSRTALLLFLATALTILTFELRLNAAAQQDSSNASGNIAFSPLSADGEAAIARFRATPGFKIDLFASEPLVANPVSFAFDPNGRVYLVETFRRRTSVYDIRKHPDWVDDDFSFRSVEDRSNFFKRVLTPDNPKLPTSIRIDRNGDGHFDYHDLEVESERIRVIEDQNGDGRADAATVFADGFNTLTSGVAAGILVRPPNVWFTCIPDLWLLQDFNGDRRAEIRRSLLHGFGVHISFGGHDLHGLAMGADGKIYFSVADRGMSVRTEGKTFSNPDSGAVMRCNPDGTEFELIATGLRNPQELAFDQFGNLWTGDNNGDGGDKARWVYVVEGSDSGWQYGWQHSPKLGLWNSEKLWELAPLNTAAYVLPPVAHIGHGPAGLAFYPGTGMPPEYDNHFFLCDFPGGVNSFALRPKGAAYEMVDLRSFLSGLYPVDVAFGPNGGAYVADWIEGWEKTDKGRIYRIYEPESVSDPAVAETKEILIEGMGDRSRRRLANLLEHADRRVRMEAQFELARRGADSIDTLSKVARKNDQLLARLHAMWALGQIGKSDRNALKEIPELLNDEDPEVRAQAAKLAGDHHWTNAQDQLISMLHDTNSRARFFAALSLGKLRHPSALEPIFQLLRENADRDPYLRHAGVMALVWINDMNALISAAKDSNSSVRLGCLLAMRRLNRPEIAMFLYDPEPQILLEAARAIYDLPLDSALSQLAALINQLPRLAAYQNRSKWNPGFETPLMRRTLHANYRLGNFENSVSLAEYAAKASNNEILRAEALDLLRYWEKPNPRDRLLGSWRPLPERNARGPALAVKSHLPEILQSAPEQVRVAATRCAVAFQIKTVSSVLSELIPDKSLSAQTRIEALRALISLDAPRIREALVAGMADQDESVRREATQWFAKRNPNDAIASLAVTLESGTIGEKQTALKALSELKSPIVDRILYSWLELLRTGKLPEALRLDVLEAAETRTAPALKKALEDAIGNRPKTESAASFPELLFGGNPEAGRKIFTERQDVACVRCHKTDAEGGDVGPDLRGVATRRPREYLLESILFPNKEIAENYSTELVTLKNGSLLTGLRKNETDAELTLNSLEDGILVIAKNEIQDRKRGLSAMPAEIATVLSRHEIRDLIAFLSTLK